MVPCLHCREREANRYRGLCSRCYYGLDVRDLYPSDSKYAPHYDDIGTGLLPEEPTDAEPGSEEKIAVMAARAEVGDELHHPRDRKRTSTTEPYMVMMCKAWIKR